jgi:hypothetical protein
MPDLNHAIQLIRQGQKWEAQRILQELIKSAPGNIQAWFWYVETCTTTERRIQVLEECLKMNPGNQQVMKAIQAFRSQLPAVQTQPVIQQPSPSSLPEPTPSTQPVGYSYEYDQKIQNDQYKQEDPYASYSSYTSTPEPVKINASQKKPWEMDESEYVDTSMLSKPRKPVRTYAFYDVWLTVTTIQDVEAYEDVLKDPQMGLGRAFTWIAIAGLIAALTLPLQFITNSQFSELTSLPEFQSTFGSMESMAFLTLFTILMVFVAPISSVINLAITGGLQSFLAGFFGGTGNFTRTTYALAAFIAPITILTSLLAVIPLVGQCLTFPLAFYNIVLNVRALRAAHSISIGAAIGVIFAPGILAFIFSCLLFFLVGGAGLSQ